MVTREAGEYHPYAVCLMFKTCHDGEIVRANLDAVMAAGAQAECELRAADQPSVSDSDAPTATTPTTHPPR